MKQMPFFPQNEEKVDFVLSIYASEIQRRSEYVLQAKKELDETMEIDIDPIRKVMEIINHSAAISRMKRYAGKPRSDEIKKVMNERIRAVKKKWDSLPKEPKGLIDIRNDLEHFENKLDEWAAKSQRHIFIGSIKGNPNSVRIEGDGSDRKFWRSLNGNTFQLFDHSVNLIEVCEWVKKMAEKVSN